MYVIRRQGSASIDIIQSTNLDLLTMFGVKWRKLAKAGFKEIKASKKFEEELMAAAKPQIKA